MPVFLPPLLLAILLLIFIQIGIRVIHGDKTELQIEIQPLRLVLTDYKSKKSDKKEKNNNNTKEILNLVRLALPYSTVTVSKLDVSVFSDELFSLYTNTAYLGSALYPLLSYIGLQSKKLTVELDALECTPANKKSEQTSLYIDVTFELALYTVICVITKQFLFKKRREKRARRNERAD